MFVTYPDACWCQLITIDDRIEALPIRMRVDPRCGAAHDRSDEPRTHASAGPTPQRRFHKLRRGLQSGGAEKQLVLSSSERLKPGQNSPCSTHPHPNRDKTLPAQAKRPEFHVFGRAGGILSRKCPNVRALGEFCHGHAPKFLDRARSVRPSAVRSHVHPLAHTSTGYSIDGQAPHTGPARPGCGARGRWRGLAGLRDRSLRAEGSRVAISRAGRRPRAHTAARRLHEHTKQPGDCTGTHSSPAAARAHKAARPWPRAAHGHTQQPGGCTST